MFVLAIGKILSGFSQLPLAACIASISLIVAAYVFSGGMMSALLTDLLQGVMCLVVLGFVMLPFVWVDAGGLARLRELPAETWDFTSPGMTLWTVAALNVSALVGGIAAPWIYNWIAVSRDERAATQCGWGHLWKRIITLLFAVYGILFALSVPGLDDPELAWGTVMKRVIPIGVGAVGLLIASFFAAAMSSADTYATTSSAMVVDYLYRRIIRPGRPAGHYLSAARIWAVASILLAAMSTQYVEHIKDYVKLCMSLLAFLGVPIYFGIAWRRANRTGMWLSLGLGGTSYLAILFLLTGEGGIFPDRDAAFVTAVFVPTALSLAGMCLGSWLGPPEDPLRCKRFQVILNTPVGQEGRLVEAGIRLPALIDAGLVEDGPEEVRAEVIERLYREDAQGKIFGPASPIEIRREPELEWYVPGFLKITACCVALVVLTWLSTRILFVW
jgi:Na+/proline symporter